MDELSFGRWLKRRRQALGMTQDDLARRVGYSLTMIRKVEADERAPSRQLAEALAVHLQIGPEEQGAFLRFARDDLREDLPALPPQAAAPVPLPALAPPHLPAPPATNLPSQLTVFVGREQELAILDQYIRSETVRLITVVGPGGMGKTRLALSAAERYRRLASEAAGANAPRFPDGIFFVSLAALNNPTLIVMAMAEAIGFRLEPGSGRQPEPREQVLDYLRPRCLLLVLDNFEHLLAGADIVADILRLAPQVTMLVTSRERLYLNEEHLLVIHGLEYPPDSLRVSDLRAEDAAAYPAIQLFVNSARRVQHDFALTDTTAPQIAHICRRVEGMPLAVELAAAWVDMLSLAEIVTEIQRSLDFLVTDTRNVPARQRSIRAVFDSTWHRLTDDERRVFAQLSVFRDGFTRDASQIVVGATLPVLVRLARKHLLQYDDMRKRYHCHALLRQYAEERLGTSAEGERLRDLHCGYYAQYLQMRLEDVLGRRQGEAIAEIAAEMENIRLAWQWAVQRVKPEALLAMTGALAQYYQMQSYFLEGAIAFEQAAQCLALADPTEPSQLAQVVVLAELGWLYVRLGRIEEAEAVSSEADALHHRLGRPPIPGLGTDPRLERGFVACARGDYASAVDLAKEACQTSITQNQPWNRQVAYDLLSRALLYQGQLDLAHHYAQQAYAATQATGDRWFMAYCLNQLGNVAEALHDYSAARGHYEVSYQLRQALADPEGMAVALNHLGHICIQQGQYAEAERLYRQSLAIYQDIHDMGGLVHALAGLGKVGLLTGNLQAARRRLAKALAIATERQIAPYTFSILVSVAELLLRTHRRDAGIEVLAFSLNHPASGHRTQKQAHELLERYRPDVPADQFTMAIQRGANEMLEAVVARVQLELLAGEGQMEVAT